MTDVVALVESVAGAIDHAAERGVHHGLLHLRDVMVAADSVRITGFGIAAALSRWREAADAATSLRHSNRSPRSAFRQHRKALQQRR